MSPSSDERLSITYQLTCEEAEDPASKARDIAVEQSVELPEGSFSQEIEDRIVGKVEALEELGSSQWKAVISYDPVIIGGEVPQLLNLIFGNISMKSGILVTELDLPTSLLASFPGPRYGIDGLREITRCEERRPLLCGVSKPIGLSSEQLADICYRLALGGIDIVKDDHSLANQEMAPFKERVARCLEAVDKANEETGGKTIYFPNLTLSAPVIGEHLEFIRSLGCRGVVVSPLLVGLDTVRWIAESSELVIFSHLTFAGTFFHETHGIAPAIMFGKIFRIIGSDGVIYPVSGGRFNFSESVSEAINVNLRKPLGSMRPAFPVLGGGVDAARVPSWISRYGVDTVFLIGGSLHKQPDLTEATRRLVEAVRRHSNAQ